MNHTNSIVLTICFSIASGIYHKESIAQPILPPLNCKILNADFQETGAAELSITKEGKIRRVSLDLKGKRIEGVSVTGPGWPFFAFENAYSYSVDKSNKSTIKYIESSPDKELFVSFELSKTGEFRMIHVEGNYIWQDLRGRCINDSSLF